MQSSRLSSVLMGPSKTPNEDSPRNARKEEIETNTAESKDRKLLTKFNFAQGSVFSPKQQRGQNPTSDLIK